MKLKNSYILLIAMAIFLLVSIGSVCANENITADSDAKLATSEPDVVLADGENAGDETTQEKINTTVKADDKEFDYDDDKNLTVDVLDNTSTKINVNESDLNVFEGNQSLNFLYNNSILSIKDKLSVGNHSIIINYLGNATYANSTKTITVSILGNKTLEAPETIVKTGADTKFEISNVKVFDGVKNIELVKDNFKLNVTYVDENGDVTSAIIDATSVENGTVIFNYDKLVKSVTLNYTDAVNNRTIAVKYGTTVNADDAKIKTTEDKNITVTVTDNYNNALNITKSDLKVLENGKEISFDFNDSVISIKDLAIGIHELTIVYAGNDTLATSNKTVTVKVWGNQTIKPNETVILDKDNNVEIYLNITDGADPVEVIKGNLTVTVFWKEGNKESNTTIGSFDLINQTIKFKFDEKFDSAYAEIKYVAETNLTGKTTLKVGSEIEVTPKTLEKGVGEEININVDVTTLAGTKINVTATDFKVLNNGKEVKFTYNDSVITITDKFTFGNYNLTVQYIGNNTYSTSEKVIPLTVYGINATSSTNINSTKKGEIKLEVIKGNETVDILLKDLNLTVSYKNGNVTKNIAVTEFSISNGTLSFTLENANFTTATLTIKYNNATEANVTLNRVYNAKFVVINDKNEYKTGNFTFRLVDEDDGSNLTGISVTLYTTGNIRAGFSATTDSNGIATFKTTSLYVFDQSSSSLAMKELEVGKYAVELSTSGSVKTTPLNTNLTITPANIKIVLNPYKEYYTSTKKVTFTVTNSLNEPMSGIYLKLTIDSISGTYYLQTNSEGLAEISVYNDTTKSGLVSGDYVFTATNNDTKNIVNTTGKGTVTIVKLPVNIKINGASTIYYNSGTTATIKVTDQSGKALEGAYILVEIDKDSKKTYLFQTNSKGEIAFSASLPVGKHTIKVTSADNRYDASAASKTITVKKASAKITAKKVKTYYKAGKYLTVKVKNTKNKKAIYDAKVNIKIYVSKNRFYNYNGSTGANGKLKLLLDSLKPGKYKVVISGADSKDFSAKDITTKIVIKKAPTKFVAKKVTAKKGKNKYFKITAKNKKTKKGIPKIKVKVKVFTGKKSKTYTLKTNAKGIAKLNVKKLKVGKHKVTIKSANKYCVAKQKKSKITIKK